MEAKKLIALIKGDPKKLKDWFNRFDSRSNTINDWQTLLGYPLEPHSCQICHRIRSSVKLAVINASKPKVASIYINEAIYYIEKGDIIKSKMNDVYPLICELLYSSD